MHDYITCLEIVFNQHIAPLKPHQLRHCLKPKEPMWYASIILHVNNPTFLLKWILLNFYQNVDNKCWFELNVNQVSEPMKIRVHINPFIFFFFNNSIVIVRLKDLKWSWGRGATLDFPKIALPSSIFRINYKLHP